MLTKKDIAIQELCKRDNLDTFYKQIYIRKPNDAIIADSQEDFMNQITDPCHIWQGSQTHNGYGHWNAYSKTLGVRLNVRAHRLAYALAYGFEALPKSSKVVHGDMLILNHLCFTTLCVNPEHLEVITFSQNVKPNKRKPKYD